MPGSSLSRRRSSQGRWRARLPTNPEAIAGLRPGGTSVLSPILPRALRPILGANLPAHELTSVLARLGPPWLAPVLMAIALDGPRRRRFGARVGLRHRDIGRHRDLDHRRLG